MIDYHTEARQQWLRTVSRPSLRHLVQEAAWFTMGAVLFVALCVLSAAMGN